MNSTNNESVIHSKVSTDPLFSVSRMPSHTQRVYTTYPISVILKEIQSGATHIPAHDRIKDKTLRGITHHARHVLELNNIASEPAYAGIKKSMPAFCPAGILGEDSKLVQISQLGCLDVDQTDDVAYSLSLAAQTPHTLAAFRSLRGNRLKVLVKLKDTSLSGTPLTPDTFTHAILSAVTVYEELGEIDLNSITETSLCALVHDPNVYINHNSIPLAWDVDFDTYFEATATGQHHTEMSALASLPIEYLDAIATMEWQENGWGRSKLPCFDGNHEHDGWGQRTNGMAVRKNGDNDYTFFCHKCPPDSKSKRFSDTQKVHRTLERLHTQEAAPKQPRNKTERKCRNASTQKQELEHRRETLNKQLISIFQQIDTARAADNKDPMAFLINGFTGLGKSYAAKEVLTTNIDRFIETETAIISISLNSDIRDQDYVEMQNRYGPDRVFNWKGRKHGFDKISHIPREIRKQNETLLNHGAMCQIVDVVEEAQNKGINAYDICKRCPFVDNCNYWKQYSDILGALYICISFPDLLDPKFRNFLRELQRRTQLKIDTLIYDDYTLQNIISEVALSVETLYQAMENRKQGKSENMRNATHILNLLFEAVIELFVSKDHSQFYRKMKGIHKFLNVGNSEELDGIREALSKCMWENKEVQPRELLDMGIPISQIPYTWDKSDNLIDRIVYFLQDSTEQNANVTATLERVSFTHKARLHGSGIKYLLFLSATTDTHAVQKCFADGIEFHIINIPVPTQLARGNRFFQLRDNLVTSQSVFTYQDRKVTGLTETAKMDILKLCDLTQNEKERTGYKAVLISHMQFSDNTIKDCDVVRHVHEVFDTLTYYQRVTGLNWKDYHIYCCYGLPKSMTHAILHLAGAVNSGDTKQMPRGKYTELIEFKRIAYQNMSMGRNAFKDSRQEQARMQFVDALLQQGAGRARLFVWENRLLIVHSNQIIDESPHAQIYNRSDLHIASTFDELAECITARETAYANLDVKTIAETEKVTERSAYNRTKQARKCSKSERNTSIIRMHKDGIEPKDIAAYWGIHRTTVERILKQAE